MEAIAGLIGGVVKAVAGLVIGIGTVIFKLIELMQIPKLIEIIFGLIYLFFMRVWAFAIFIYTSTIFIIWETKEVFLKIMIPVVKFLRIPEIGWFIWASFVWWWLLTIDIAAEFSFQCWILSFNCWYYFFRCLDKSRRCIIDYILDPFVKYILTPIFNAFIKILDFLLNKIVIPLWIFVRDQILERIL